MSDEVFNSKNIHYIGFSASLNCNQNNNRNHYTRNKDSKDFFKSNYKEFIKGRKSHCKHA